jgi:hypothetical protein
MKLFKIMGLCFVAAMALSAVVSASASATKNPQWVICENVGTGGHWEDAACSKATTNGSHETRLLAKENETREIQAVQISEQTLKSTAATIICTKLSLAKGSVLLGGEPGKDNETIVYSGCTTNIANCTVRSAKAAVGTIETNRLISTLTYSSKEAEEKENQAATLTIFKPGTGKVFVDLILEGTGCPESLRGVELPVDGEVACTNEKGNAHSVSHELVCPKEAIKTYWLQVAGAAKEEKVTKLELGGMAATYSGTSSISLAGSQEGQDWWII